MTLNHLFFEAKLTFLFVGIVHLFWSKNNTSVFSNSLDHSVGQFVIDVICSDALKK